MLDVYGIHSRIMVDCATNLKSLENFSLSSSWDEVSRMSVEEFDDFLADRGLLWKARKCPNCCSPRQVSGQPTDGGRLLKMRFECSSAECRKSEVQWKVGYLKDTFFENLVGSRKKLFLASALFADDVGTFGDRAKRCSVNKNTMTQWSQWFRDVIVESFFENETPRKIGGPNTVLQLEETYIVHRKCYRGRAVRDSWVVGGIVNDTKEIFVEISSTRDPATLDSIIAKHVLPGTTIGNLGFVHNTVDTQEQKATDPSPGVDPQGIEAAWSAIKRAVKKYGLKGALENDRFLESVWRWQHHNDPKLYLLWRQISKLHPLVD